MAMQQSLLDKPRKPISKVICLALSSLVVLSSFAYIASYFIKPTFFDHSSYNDVCDHAHDTTSCLAHVSEIIAQDPSLTATKDNKFNMLHSFLVKSTSHIERAVSITNATRLKFNGPGEEVSLDECVELMNLSKERIWNSLVALKEKSTESMQDAHTWLSSVLTNYQTFLDDLQGRPHELLEVELQNLISRARTSLAMLVAILPPKVENIIDKNLKTVNGNFPSWVTSKDRRLLESTARDIKANVVVADDGTGNFKTVKEAVASVPKNSKTRYVIYVKAGLYREIVEISSNKRNVMLVGDGMEETIITGGLNYKDIKNTFRTATVAAVGDGFIAQDI